MAIIKQNTVFQRQFNLKLTGTQNPATGKAGSLVAKISKNGAALATPAGAVSELAQGAYVIAYTAADTNTVGSLGLYVTDAACDPYNAPDLDQILPGTLLTGGTGADQINPSAGGVLLAASDLTATFVSQALVPFGVQSVIDGAPTANGFVSGLTGTSADDDFFRGYLIQFISGALAGENRQILSYTASTKRIVPTHPFTRAPANGDTFRLVTAVDVSAAAGMDRLLGLTAENVVEDDVVMDPNGSGYRVSWNYYLYDTAAHATAHVTGGGGGTGLLYKYAVLRVITSGIVKRATVTRVL